MNPTASRERRSITVSGIVQGVGFRPHVFTLASQLGLSGFVKNDGGQVWIEIEGSSAALDCFVQMLSLNAPACARIERVTSGVLETLGGNGFEIFPSAAHSNAFVRVSPDLATCPACAMELFDPHDRRYGYPFLNCTHCGPRLTIITGVPYDRERTTMTGFPMCPMCRAEYESPADRRFHAQPIACPACGPRLQLLDEYGTRVDSGTVRDSSSIQLIRLFADEVRAGRIGAIKGLGGYHLTCDARNREAVGELRRRKHRDERPFAVMVRNAAAAAVLCEISPGERQLLESPSGPIVLLRKRVSATDAIAPEVVLTNPNLGVMLPYSPLHQLLMQAVDGMPLVMTSGNRADEPIAYQDDAPQRLAGIADLFLTNNRPIRCRADDSVTRVVAGRELPVRRSRGYAPQPIGLPFDLDRSILAVGGQLKATFALGSGSQAILSHHVGDLQHFEAFQAFERDVVLYERLFGIRPRRLAHDLHPDYASTVYARERAAREGLELIAVQHHHAHMASVMAENGLCEPVIGIAFDGTGYGTDGAIWGGEFLVGDYRGFRRAGHLRYVALPGGEQAIREPWRMAAAHLLDAGLDLGLLQRRHSTLTLRNVETMIGKRLNAPLTSSVGRLFDAVAAIAGTRDRNSYEGQAAMEWEWLAAESSADEVYPVALTNESPGNTTEPAWIIDTRPLIRAIAGDVADGVETAVIARRFHDTLADAAADLCVRIRSATDLNTVVLSGGVFHNVLLATELSSRLIARGFDVHRHQLVPPNDGGLSLGQLAIAAASGE